MNTPFSSHRRFIVLPRKPAVRRNTGAATAVPGQVMDLVLVITAAFVILFAALATLTLN